MRITWKHKDILARMADGWRPFPFQLSGLEKALLRNQLVAFAFDERGNTVLDLTAAGRSAATVAPPT